MPEQLRIGSQRQKGPRLSASTAHEINNPLHTLIDLLFLIEGDPNLSNQSRSYLTLACDEAKRISQIVHGVMCGSDGEENRKRTNIPQLLKAVIDTYRSRLLAHGISITGRYCPDGELVVEAGSLRQVFSSLLLNAAEAMPAGGTIYARVSAAQEWSGAARHGLRVTFADHGCGIPAENLLRLGQPFFTTKRAVGGTGIGLSLVKEFVRRHDGGLRVRSSTKADHSGSVFAIFLPASVA